MSDLLFIYISLVVIGIIVLFFYNQVLSTCFFKHSYIKFIWEFFIFIFSVLTFFYSLNYEIFSNKNLKENFFVYPINQLKRNTQKYPQLISLHSLENKDSLNFIFIVDRTLSNRNKKNSDRVKKLIYEIKQGDDSSNIQLSDTSHFLMCDFIVHEMIASLSRKGQKFKSSIIVYNGIKNGMKRDTQIVNNPINFRSYLKIIKKKENQKTNTDITRLFQLMGERNRPNHIVTIISDFEHEKDTYILEREIEKFTENNMDSIVLNLINIKGSQKNDTSLIRTTKDLIKKYSHFINLYEFEGEWLAQNSNEAAIISDFITQKSKRDTQQIIFYYPLSFGKFQIVNKSLIRFYGNIMPDSFLFNLKNELISHDLTPLKIISTKVSKTPQLTDHPKSIQIEDSTDFSFVLESQYRHDNLFLEISKNKDLVRKKIPIVFQECLSDVVCYTLFIMNALVFILMIFLSLFFYKKTKHCYKIKYHDGLDKGSFLILVFPILSTMLFAAYILKLYIVCQEIKCLPVFFELVGILIVFMSFLFLFYKTEKKTFDLVCNELHK